MRVNNVDNAVDADNAEDADKIDNSDNIHNVDNAIDADNAEKADNVYNAVDVYDADNAGNVDNTGHRVGNEAMVMLTMLTMLTILTMLIISQVYRGHQSSGAWAPELWCPHTFLGPRGPLIEPSISARPSARAKNPDHLYSLIIHHRTTVNPSNHIFSESW